MDILTSVITDIDYLLDTKRKRHLTGGLLISLAFLFAGLAVTVATLKEEEHE